MPTIDTTPLPEAFTAGVSTGHIAHSVELIRQLYNAEIFANTVNVMSSEYGAVDGGSAATNTTALNNARADIVATGKPGCVYIPAGVDLPVTPDAVLGGSDVTYFGGGKLSTIQTTVGALITIPAGTTGATVDGLVFESPNDAIVGVQIVSAASSMCNNIAVCNNECINARCVETNVIGTYAGHSTHATTGTVTRNVTVRNNRGKRTGANTTNKAFILIWYTIGAEVIGNRIDAYGYGIQWWGGDADPVSADGALANERKCGEVTITGNRVKDMLDVLGGGAGIWGSMGYKIAVTGNVIDDCADVGIDFEGCVDCTASGNMVSNAVNGNLTSFFYNRAVRFSGNTCSHRTTGRIMARVQNNYPTSENKDITLDANTFYCPLGVIARISLETSQRSILRDNTLTNVYITGEVNNVRNTTIKNNDLVFDTALGTDPGRATQADAIHVGKNHLGGRAIICGNTIESTVVQPATANAISTYQDDSTRDVLEIIDDNLCLGWTEAIHTTWNGDNAGFTARTFIRRNTVDVGATIVNTRGAASLASGIAGTIVKEGNRYADGTAYP